MVGSSNDWLRGPAGPTPSVEQAAVAAIAPPPVATGPLQPQRGIRELESADRLPRRQVEHYAHVWFVGAHGGAGESTLAQLFAGSGDAHHSWPIAAPATTRVVLVARANANGLVAAQRAATEWASGTLPTVQLLGLAVLADAPGRMPKPLRELAARVAGGVPRTWSIPWVEAWRLGEPPRPGNAPAEARALVADIESTIRNSSI